MICDRCQQREAVDTFPANYDYEGNPIDEEALCEVCLFEDDARELLLQREDEV